MVLVRRFWFWVIFFTITIAGCSPQVGEEKAPEKIVDPGPNDQEVTPELEEKLPTSEPNTAEVEQSTTTVSAPTPTALIELTKEDVQTSANADVLFVKARQESEDTWYFTVTVEHPDTGWEDYANGWDVVLPDGSVARPDQDSPFTRVLLHPHETEQPFTRSQGGIEIAPGIVEVTVRAHDLIDGFGGREVVVNLMSKGDLDYEVQRLSE